MATTRSEKLAELARRGRWTAEDARLIFRAWRQSEISLAEFALRNDLNVRRLYWWRGRLGETDPEQREHRVFEEVTIHPPAATRDEGRFEVEFRSGLVIRVATSFDEASLRRLLIMLGDLGVAC